MVKTVNGTDLSWMKICEAHEHCVTPGDMGFRDSTDVAKVVDQSGRMASTKTVREAVREAADSYPELRGWTVRTVDGYDGRVCLEAPEPIGRTRPRVHGDVRRDTHENMRADAWDIAADAWIDLKYAEQNAPKPCLECARWGGPPVSGVPCDSCGAVDEELLREVDRLREAVNARMISMYRSNEPVPSEVSFRAPTDEEMREGTIAKDAIANAHSDCARFEQGVVSADEMRGIMTAARIALDFGAAVMPGMDVRVDGNVVTISEVKADRTTLPAGWQWDKSYTCRAFLRDDDRRRFSYAGIESVECGLRGRRFSGGDDEAPVGVWRAIEAEARRLGIPVASDRDRECRTLVDGAISAMFKGLGIPRDILLGESPSGLSASDIPRLNSEAP